MSKLSGDPGIWASLNLARHGDKDAARRALEVFSTSAGPTVYDRLHLNLQKRLVVLLSNSAARSHLPQPPRWGKAEKEQIEIYADYLTWWNENHATLELWDPWLPALVQQKIE